MVNSPQNNKSEVATSSWERSLNPSPDFMSTYSRQAKYLFFDSEYLLFLPISQYTVAKSKVKYNADINKLMFTHVIRNNNTRNGSRIAFKNYTSALLEQSWVLYI
jgi:hypothetical protein